MSGERNSVWDDPMVKEALNDGRSYDDIAVLNCPRCGRLSYYNQGSHFACRHCDEVWYVASDNEEVFDGRPYMRPEYILTLDDVLDAECSDYP